MIFDWYLIFNVSDFDSGLISKSYTNDLEDIGEKTVLVTNGNILSVVYDGVMLSPDLAPDGDDIHYMDGYAVQRDFIGNVFIGIEVV